MNRDIEARREFICNQVGEGALQILRDTGLDVDLAITRILREQEEQQAMRELQTAVLDTNNTMSSELVYLSRNLEDIFGQEYTRRLRLIGLSDDNIKSLYHQEKLISSDDMNGQRKQPWVQRYFIFSNLTPDSLPKVGEMTLSELILITDDANSAFWRDHGALPEAAWQALCIAACCAQYTEGRYAHAFNDRTGKLGWLKEQGGAYTRNECLLTERLKWGHNDKPAWTSETTNLEQFKR